jgi:hypothetical protein
MLEIGPCDYLEELTPHSDPPQLTADSPVAFLSDEKAAQADLMADVAEDAPSIRDVWTHTDDVPEDR